MVARPGRRPLAAAVGIIADRTFGEFPGPHPLSGFGSAMAALERRAYAPTRRAGAAYAITGAAAGIATGIVVPSNAAAAWFAIGARALHEAALDVAAALDIDDVDRARSLLPNLVGRDPSTLDESGIARAVVESVAENTVDALIAPALWAAAAGGPGVLAHRAVDTLDSMVGYRNERYREFGWASARLDDVAAWVPARIGVGLVATVRPHRIPAIARAVHRDARGHPSPNAGVIEAAFAGAMDIQLGGATTYDGITEDRPALGAGPAPRPSDIARAVALSSEVGTALAGALGGYGLARLISSRRRRR